MCYRSLIEKGCDVIANGPITDCIRRVECFGINLSALDIRQDGERHVKALSEITQFLELGRLRFMGMKPLGGVFCLSSCKANDPLIPRTLAVSDETQEVLDTVKVIAEQPRETLSHYVISMAQQASDVLAVALLLREGGVNWKMPVVPLFETLADLDRGPQVMQDLWSLDWYKAYCDGTNSRR